MVYVFQEKSTQTDGAVADVRNVAFFLLLNGGGYSFTHRYNCFDFLECQLRWPWGTVSALCPNAYTGEEVNDDNNNAFLLLPTNQI